MSFGFNEPSGLLSGCLMAVGLAMAGLFSLATFGAIVNDEPDPLQVYIALFVFIAAGGAVFAFGVVQRKKSRRLKSYIDLVRKQGYWSLAKIAKVENVTDVGKVMKEIRSLISTGPLYGYRIDPDKLTITPFDPSRPPEPPRPRLVKFTCPACGAGNRFETADPAVKCEFCGTPWVG